MHVRTLPLVAIVLLAACVAPPGPGAIEPPEPFETRISLLVDADNDPLADATSITVRLRAGDETIEEKTYDLGGDEPDPENELRLEGLSPADLVSVDVEVRSADGEIAGLGRSQSFALGSAGLQAAVFVGAADSISRVPDSLSRARAFAQGACTPGGRLVVVGGGDNDTETIAPVEFVGWFATEPVTALAGAEVPRIGHQVAYVPEGAGDWGGKVVVFGGTWGAGDDTLNGGWENAAKAVAVIDPVEGSVDHDGGTLDFGYMDSRGVWTAEGLFALLGGYNRANDGSLPYTDRIILIDPADGEQFEGPELTGQSTREQHAAVAFEAQGEDRVLISGGYLDGAPPTYVAVDLIWSGQQSDAPVRLVRPLGTARARHQATDLGTGQVLITGGAEAMTTVFDDGEPLDTAEIFDPGPDGGSFEALTSALVEARQRHVAARIPGGRVLLCGGQGLDGVALTTCEAFSLDTRHFDPFPASVIPGGPGMEAIEADDGRVYFVGGASELGPTRALHVYTPPSWQDD